MCIANIAKMIIVHCGVFSFNITISLKHLNSWYICIMQTEKPLCVPHPVYGGWWLFFSTKFNDI